MKGSARPISIYSFIPAYVFSTLSLLHAGNDYTLQVEMVDSSGTYKRATYEKFVVGAGPTYQLTVDEFEADPNAFVRDAFKSANSANFLQEATDACAAKRALNVSGWMT